VHRFSIDWVAKVSEVAPMIWPGASQTPPETHEAAETRPYAPPTTPCRLRLPSPIPGRQHSRGAVHIRSQYIIRSQ
jgi:hypothetical protein